MILLIEEQLLEKETYKLFRDDSAVLRYIQNNRFEKVFGKDYQYVKYIKSEKDTGFGTFLQEYCLRIYIKYLDIQD